ncbi:MAG: hypothetical protein ACOX8H_12510 [Ruminococcus sp.]|jgi:hypothetical protein
MKRIYKILLIISAVLAGSGVVICIVGFFLGGRLGDGGLAFWNDDPENLDDTGGTFSTVWDGGEEISADTVDSLHVDIAAGTLIVEYGDYDNIRVETSTSRTKAKVWMEGDTLNIKGRGRWFSLGEGGGAVRLYLPREIKLREADLEAGAGSIEADHLRADEIIIDVGMGEFISDGLVKAEVLDCTVGMGKLEIGEADCQETYLDCSMGDLDIVMKGDWNDYYLTGDCSLGDLSVEEESWNLNSDIEYGDEDGGRTIEAECGMGDLNIGVTD